MKILKNMRIAHKLIALCLVIFLVPMTLFYIFGMRIVLSEMDQHTLSLARTFNAQVIAGLDYYIQDFEAMSVSALVDNQVFTYSGRTERTTTEMVADYTEMRKVLFRLTRLEPGMKTAAILMKAGDFAATGASGINIDQEKLLSQPWVRDIPEEKRFFYLVPAHQAAYRDRKSEELTVTFVRKIMSSGVRYMGAMLFDVDPASFILLNEELETARDRYKLEVSIFDDEGRIIYDTRPSDPENSRADGFYQRQEDDAEYIVFDGTTQNMNLRVVTAMPKASMLLDRRHVHTMITVLSVACSLLIIGLIIPFSRSFTKPLAELGAGMSRMKKGEYVPIRDYPFKDEVGDLVDSYNHMISEMQYLINRVHVSELRQRDSEIVALQSQINPHMLFNTLESIRMSALMNGDTVVSKMISSLARMFRTILDSMGREHSIRDEVKYAEEFIELQNLGEDDKYTFSCDVEEELMRLECIPIFFQPLVENAMKHGQCNREGKLNIRIGGERRENLAVFTVTDDGQGMSTENLRMIQEHLEEVRREPHLMATVKKTKGRTIGMANILMRLKLNGDEQGDVRIRYSGEGGTCIEIIMSAQGNPDGEEE